MFLYYEEDFFIKTKQTNTLSLHPRHCVYQHAAWLNVVILLST